MFTGLLLYSQILKKITDRAKIRAENYANNKVNYAVDKTEDDAVNPDKDNNSGNSNSDADAGKKNEAGRSGALILISNTDFFPVDFSSSLTPKI